MRFLVQIDKRAIQDIQHGIDYYEEQVTGLGDKFLNEVDLQIELLSQNPFFQVRYSSIRCLPVGRFPFMLHFSILEKRKIIRVHGVIHTSLNPKKYWVKKT